MAAHKFILGQKVTFRPEYGQSANRREVFTVIRQLPESDGVLQYQIKSDRDGHLRMVPERQVADYRPGPSRSQPAGLKAQKPERAKT